MDDKKRRAVEAEIERAVGRANRYFALYDRVAVAVLIKTEALALCARASCCGRCRTRTYDLFDVNEAR